ncbi:hypothetical protein X777_12406 [Ooceraea biroi]|uniref:Titin n=1 Tax=Ooceraea biroi TaxID=2015173 RepID=A0A026VZ57_OOCBI|nr:hypothetical protein X777_12406 [Ooceraea biroi]
MTIHKKGEVLKTKDKGIARNEASTETYEAVSSTSVVEEARQVTESESRSSVVEMTSASREVIMDSKGNIVKVIETSPQTVQRSSSSHRTGKSSQDFIAGEQMQSIKQAKTAREIAREGVESLAENRNLQGETTARASQSVQMQNQSESRSMIQQSSSTVLESSSTSEDRRGHRSTVTLSHDVRSGDHAPLIQTSSRSTESTRASSETSEAVTRDGHTVSNTTRMLETGERIDDNGRTMSTSSREVDSERAIAPLNEATIKNTDDVKRSGDKSTRSDSKSERSNVEISSRCNKPGQSTWDGTFVYEKPSSPRGKSGDKNVVDKATPASSKVRDDRRDSETSVKVTQEASASEKVSVTDQIVSSTSTVTRDSKTIIDEGQLSTTTRLRDSTMASDKIATDTTDLAKGPVRCSRPGDSSWDGSFVMEKSTAQPKRRNDPDAVVFHHGQGDNVVGTTQKTDFREKSTDGTYEKESSETMRVVKGATDSTSFISEERHDVSRESSIHADGSPSSKEQHLTRISSPSQRRVAKPGDSTWNSEFIYEKLQDAASKRPLDVTVVRRTEKCHDSVDVQDVTEEQNVSESVSTSYIVEYAISSDKKNVEKITSVSEVILEEDGPEDRTVHRQSASPEGQPKRDTTSRCYKPGQSTWDGTFVHERPRTPDTRRRPEGRRATKAIDIRDVTEDNSINEADFASTSYVVEHSSSQQSFSDVRDANLTSAIYETVVHEGRPVETTIRFDEGKVSTTERQASPSPRRRSPEKVPRDKDVRTTKPGSSTWDGTFVSEKPHGKKRPPSRECADKHPDKPRQHDRERTSPDTMKGHKETTVDLQNVARDKSSISEIVESSAVVEQSSAHESYTDSSNVHFSTTSFETVIRDGQPVTTQKTVTIQEGPRSPIKRLPGSDVIITADVKETTVESPEKKEPRPDRNYRPTKPGSSTWDGSFVYEKPEERKPGDKKIPKDTPGTVDKRSPIKEKPDTTDHRTSVTILDTSKDVTSSAEYTTSSVTVGRAFISDSKTRDSSNVSKIFIEGRTENYEKPRQDLDEKPKPSPRQRPDDGKAPKDEKPQKSPVDRIQRPSKPGASTWDGSFVYEKRQDSQRKPADGEPTEESRKPSDQRKPIEQGKKPTDQRDRPTPIVRKPTGDKKPQQDATEMRYIEDVADITRTSEMLQQSSYVIDQSASFTSVQDVRNVTDERVITEFTKDTRKDVRDVTESTKEFIDKEQVTSMVARDVVDNARFDTIISSAPRSPTDSTRKPLPERPGYPRGIPGLREDDRPKPIPAAGKPSRPTQRERSPQQRTEYGRPSEVRPKSPEKLRDYTSPTRKPQPAAGKPSRPEEKSIAPRKSDEEPRVPKEQKPATGKLSRPAEKPKRPQQDHGKSKRGDQIPDSIDEDTDHYRSVPKPAVLSTILLKEQCICELCTCGRHRCPHNLTQENLDFSYEEPVDTVTSYRQDYDVKRVEKQTKYYHTDHLRTEGEFIGERRTDYVARRANNAKVAATTTTDLVFTGTPGERPTPIRRNTYTKTEGDFIDETTTRSQYIDHRSIQRAEIVKRTDNLTVGEGEFTGTSRIKEDFQTHVVEREPRRRPKYSEDTDRFYSKTDITDSTTTTQEQYRTFDQTDYRSATVIKRTDNLRPEGPFEALPHTKDDYVAPILSRRPEPQKPKDNLKPEGPFEGKPKDDYRPTRGERADVKRPEDNLRPEGPFEGRPKDDYLPKRGERPEVRRPEDNLRPEGPFEARPKDDYKPTRGERFDVKRPEDNLRPEGPFEGRPKDDFSPKTAERPEVKRPKDNLRSEEGDFIGKPKDDYRPTKGERADVKKPEDNLRPQGPFEGRPKDDYSPKRAERPEVKKPQDNLKPEGFFEVRPKDDYKPTRGERADVKRPEDNLRPEGPFEGRPKDDYKPTRGERADVKRPEDNLRPEGPPEGEFTGKPKDDFTPVRGDRADVKRPEDNLRPEGPFEGRPKDDYLPKRAERPEVKPDVKKPKDNLRPEGDFERPEKVPIGPAERRSPIKHPDNLKPEGDFERPELEGYRPAERQEVKKPIDNLKPEGEFERPRPEKYFPAEKRTPVKHSDNLKPEGKFTGERMDIVKHLDNLRPEGPFEGRPKDDYLPKKAERPEIKKPEDNLKPEGDFVRQKVPIGPAERRSPIKHPDNLKPEGDFERPELEGYRPAERQEVKKPIDNLKPEGEFERPRPEKYFPAEKRTPVKHSDNLKPEGKFTGKPKDDFTPVKAPTKVVKGERMDIVKHLDNLRPEGPFEGRPKDDYLPKKAERPEIKKPEDNLKPEGDFVRRPKEEAPKKGERADIKKPKDNLRPEGDFERPEKKPISPAERRTPIKHTDNLKPEGEFERPKPEEFKPAERPVVKKPEDNLKPEGEFVTRPRDKAPTKEKVPIGPAERRSPIKHPDNLKPEGDFERPELEGYRPAERQEVKKPIDNLKPEGEFERPRPEKYFPAEKRTPVKHSDNLKPEGKFTGRPKDDYLPKKAERPEIKKPEDNLKPEGDFVRRERADIKKPKDNLRPEGDFERPEKKPISPAERRTPIKHTDNLKPEGEFERPKPEEFKPAERPVVKKPEDNLKPEGEFVTRPRDKAPTKGDRADVKKPKDNLRPEGDFERPEKVPIGPAERRSPIKHPDNLKPEGDFERPELEGYRPAERQEVKKPVDNLKPEGEFERPRPEKYSPAEKRTPVKHSDNLKPEGKFTGKPKDDFTPVKGERADVKRPEDNLRPEGPFEGRPKDDYRPVRGERMDVVKRTDNLRMEGDIETYRSRDEYTDFLIRERTEITKYQDNLRMEGEFTDTRTRDDFKVVKGERMDIVKHLDNLRPEGPFEGRPKDDYSPKKAERPEIKKPEDNLKPEGDFVRRPKEEAPKKGERADVKKPTDNLRPEGDFERPEKKPVGPAERRSPIKHSDNLRPEGEFERPKPEEFKPAERPTVKKPHDNLKPEGEFVSRPKDEAPRKEKKPVGPAERRSPIKHSDNLKPEGDFERPKHDKYQPAERPQVKKPSDNLRPEGRSPIKHPDNLHPEGDFVGRPKKDTPLKGDRADVKKPRDNLRPEGEFAKRTPKKVEPAERRSPIKHEDNLHPEGDFYMIPKDDFTPKRGDRSPVKKPQDNLRPEGEMDISPKDDYKHVNGERVEIRRHEDHLRMEGQMDIHRSRDDYKKISRMEKVDVKRREDNLRVEGEFIDVRRKDDYIHVVEKIRPGERRSPIRHADNLKPEGDFVGRPRDDFTRKRAERAEVVRREDNLKMTGEHMESSITLGDDATMMTTTNQRNYNTYTKRTGKDIAAKMSQIESDTRKSMESQTLADGSVVTVRRTTTSAQSITEGLNHRGQIIRGEDTSRYPTDITHGEHHRHQQHVERHHQEISKRDYVNAQHMDSRQRSATEQHEQRTIPSQARYNTSPELRQTINGQSTMERSHVDSATKTSHHRRNIISSSSADVSNAVLHRRGATTSTEALHTISSTAADQRKSISNLAESGRYISNSSQSNDRRSFTSLHRSTKDANPWASSSYERPQRIVRQDNLTVGGRFYSQSEAKSYGNFSQSTQKVERTQKRTNVSNINLGDSSTVASSSMYKREFVPRHRGPCPAALLEAKQAPFKHTRDTQKHKFYLPVVSN